MRILIILYAIFLISFTVFSYLFVDKNLFYLSNLYTGFATYNREVVSLVFSSSVVVFFSFYFYFLKKINKRLLMNLMIISIVFLFFSYPAILSYDIFNYIFTAKVLIWYQENPFIIMPVEFLGDPLLQFTHAANKVALYGPSWISITVVPYLLGFNNFILTLFNFKLVALVFYLGIGYLIYKFTKNIDNVAYFSLSPLVLIETLVSGHNDVSMMFFALLSIFLLKKEKLFFAVIFLFFSIFIKYATILLIPIFVYYIFMKIKKIKMDWEKIYLIGALLMFMAFILSPIREEIYPWYLIWFIAFVSLIKNKYLRVLGFALSFGLLFRYIPFMYLGTHFGITPILKIIFTYIPIGFVAIYYLIDSKIIKKPR